MNNTDLSMLKIHITGVVQGVGFRPFIYGLADRYQLYGWVRNTSAGVDIEVEGSISRLEPFLAAISDELPPLARIDSLDTQKGELNGYKTFEIMHSAAQEGAFQPISPDMCVCVACVQELFDPADRRYRYPFINCTHCGPRLTIIEDIPYDRPKTTMAPFQMCAQCAREYVDPLDRRFHAQPVACPDCGPQIWMETGGRRIAAGETALQQVRSMLQDGKILAIKGLGGFHLACDATSAGAVEELRRRKHRIEKPFALMFPDLATIEKYCELTAKEKQILASNRRPIVLVRRKMLPGIVPAVAPGQQHLGVMLPYTPLHYLLVEKAADFPQVLVMTSANYSEEPIVTQNQQARTHLAELADAFLLHDRHIHVRCDDSVARVFGQTFYPIRRSRGYAPDPIMMPAELPPLLATGAELKNTFCLTNGRYAFLSHHIGDLENLETLQSFEEGIAHYEQLFRVTPQAIACDLHPDYMATQYALERARSEDLALFTIQHHHAHIAACMAENGLDGTCEVIGVSFDGSGYGEDGAIWGGEFLVAGFQGFHRRAHLRYAPLAGGDTAIRNPWRMALAWLDELGLPWDEGIPAVAETAVDVRAVFQRQLAAGVNTARTSSVGRLFDAAAAMCGIRMTVNYEAQAAMEFEARADMRISGRYPFEFADDVLDPAPMFSAMLADIRGGVTTDAIAARFHRGLAAAVVMLCTQIGKETGIKQVALSGGVWQNMTLLSETVAMLDQAGFEVLFHQKVPANDGGLALGQAVIAAARLANEN